MDNPYRIMVVDDSEDNRDAISELLRLQNFSVEEACDGKEALNKNERFQANIFLLDVVMPVMNGLKLLEVLRVKEHSYEAVMMTAYESIDDARKAMELGALCYIKKPIVNDDLITYIQKAVDKVKKNLDAKKQKLDLEEMVEDSTQKLNETIQALKNQGQRLDAIVNSMSEGLLAIDNNDNVVMMNVQTQKILGANFFECAGENIWTLIQNKHLHEQLQLLVSRIQGKHAAVKGNISVNYGDYTITHYRVLISSIYDDNNNNMGKIITFTDDTEKVNAERLRNSFMTTMSHELRTPLNIIINYLHILRREENKSLRNELVDDMGIATRKLKLLVNGIVSLARLSDPAHKPHFTETSIDALVKIEIENLNKEILEKDLCVTINNGLEKDSVILDQKMLKIIISELLNNAVKFNTEKGFLKIDIKNSTIQKRECLNITIQDKGIGMSRETQESLFSTYFQGEDHMTRSHEGIGIGLCLVKLAVEKLEGTIQVSSAEGEGTKVSLQIPLKKKQV